jgi:hypothetical protein
VKDISELQDIIPSHIRIKSKSAVASLKASKKLSAADSKSPPIQKAPSIFEPSVKPQASAPALFSAKTAAKSSNAKKRAESLLGLL